MSWWSLFWHCWNVCWLEFGICPRLESCAGNKKSRELTKLAPVSIFTSICFFSVPEKNNDRSAYSSFGCYLPLEASFLHLLRHSRRLPSNHKQQICFRRHAGHCQQPWCRQYRLPPSLCPILQSRFLGPKHHRIHQVWPWTHFFSILFFWNIIDLIDG